MRITIFILMSFLANLLLAQDWVIKWEDSKSNFYEIQQSFNTYWQGKNIERGKGWKQFKRWENFMEPRVYPSGKLLEPDVVAREYAKYKRINNQSLKKESIANWIPKGPASWNTVSYNPGIGRVNCVTVAPNDSNIIYIGAPSGGFWKSLDNGQSWFTTTDSLTVLGVSAIAIHPLNPDIIYIGTGDGDAGDTYSIGVLYSVDGGYSWNSTGLNWQITQSRRISKIIIHPNNQNILLAATSNGIYKSTDAGINWLRTQSGNFKDMELKPGDPSIIYVSGREFYKSTNTGDSFSRITSGVPSSANVNRLAITVTPANPDYVYMLAGSAANSGFYGLYRSTNSGNSFSLRSNTPNILTYSQVGSGTGGQSWYDLAIAASPINADEIYTGGINVWRSIDGGMSWNINSYWYYPEPSIPYVHADIHSLDFWGTTLYCGSDGGIFRTLDGGNIWQDLSAGLQITQFYRIGGYPGDPDLVIGGTQDNGTNRFDSGVWTHVLGADGMEAAIDYSNPSTMYACIQNGGLRRSYDGGNSFTSIESNISENGSWVTPYVLDPIDPNTLYAGFNNVWKSTNQGDFWTSISSFSGSLRSLAVAKSDPNFIYAATYSSIRRTSDGGTSWSTITSNLPVGSASITYIAISDIDPEKIWVTFSGFSNGNKVYSSTNGGNSWTNISGNLPNIPVNCVVHKSNSNDGIYIGTDNGVFFRDGNLGQWQPFNEGLPNVIVQELEIHEQSNTIKAATYGRGLWESTLGHFGSTITHAPLQETEDVIGPYEVLATINQGSSSLLPDSLKVFYGTDMLFSNSVQLTLSANPNEYIAFIPSQGSDVIINYFISVNDSAGILVTNPLGSPSNFHSFYVGPDTVAPNLIHSPIISANVFELPLQVSAEVTDNIGIDSVWVEYRQNNIARPSFRLTTIDDINYTANFPFDSSNVLNGDFIEYRIIAQDSSSNLNQTIVGDYQFVLEQIFSFSRNLNVFITNNDTTGVYDTLTISGYENLEIVDLDLSFKASHANFGDLIVKLIAPDNSIYKLIDRPGYPGTVFGNSGNNPDIILDDGALESIEDVTFANNENVIGVFKPAPDSMSNYRGKALNGDWIIQVSDNGPAFAGNFLSWGIDFSVQQITTIDPLEKSKIPQQYVLHQNHPNPFNPNTLIRFILPVKSNVSLKIFNILGQNVKNLVNKSMEAGSHQVEFNAKNIPSGIYFYQLEAVNFANGSGYKFRQVKKMILMK